MEAFYLFARYFPFWAIPLALIFAEVARLSHKRGKKTRFSIATFLSLSLVCLTVWYFASDGFHNLNPELYHKIEKNEQR